MVSDIDGHNENGPSLNASVCYEHPLNERVRKLLRLEFLLAQTRHFFAGESSWESRTTLLSMLEILDALGRGDAKGELINELERQHGQLAAFRERPEVDQGQLDTLLDHLRDLINRLHRHPGQPGQSLRDNEFLINLRQRASIPGGTCTFDLPSLQHWLLRPAPERKILLQGWFAEFELLQEAVDTLLHLIRETGRRSQEVAPKGSFERAMDPERPFQLIQIQLQPSLAVFPEISAGRHRFTIRFLSQSDMGMRPRVTEEDIAFRLALCGA